jgi:hypothetical protein
MINVLEQLNKTFYKSLDYTKLKEVDEYLKNTHLKNSSRLEELGLLNNINKGFNIINKNSDLANQLLPFGKNCYHISQIKKIAQKYYLKFLPISYYNGEVPPELEKEILLKEDIYNIKLNQNNSFILAPPSAMKLEKWVKPKPIPPDPILFYQITDDYYCIIHKWGSDLSPLNRIKGFVNINFLKPVINGLDKYSKSLTIDSDDLFEIIIFWFLSSSLLFVLVIPIYNNFSGIIQLIILFIIIFPFNLSIRVLSNFFKLFWSGEWNSAYSNK